VQEEHTGKIPVASEDAKEGSVRLNPFPLGPGCGHVEEEGVQEADTAQVQTAEQKDPSNSSGRYSKADSWPPKVALRPGGIGPDVGNGMRVLRRFLISRGGWYFLVCW
jgi:hypothetical protein